MSSTRIYAGTIILLITYTTLARCGEIAKGPEALLPYFGEPVWTDSVYDTVLFHDDGEPQYYFSLPDIWDDHYFNVRFTPPDTCLLVSAEFYFIRIDEDTTELPDIEVRVWPSTGLYPDTPSGDPGNALDTVSVSGESINLHPEPSIVEFEESTNLHFGPTTPFHVGWDLADTAATDTILAILSDDGIPETSFSIEWWGEDVNAWGTMQNHWGIGVNFLIRVQVEIHEEWIDTTTYVWLEPDEMPLGFHLEGPYPNPFNPETSLVILLQRPQDVTLRAYDLSGRLVEEIFSGSLPAGQSLIPWQPAGLSSGAYLLRMTAGEDVVVTKATLLK